MGQVGGRDLDAMGIGAFAERAGRELLATGETAHTGARPWSVSPGTFPGAAGHPQAGP